MEERIYSASHVCFAYELKSLLKWIRYHFQIFCQRDYGTTQTISTCYESSIAISECDQCADIPSEDSDSHSRFGSEQYLGQ